MNAKWEAYSYSRNFHVCVFCVQTGDRSGHYIYISKFPRTFLRHHIRWRDMFIHPIANAHSLWTCFQQFKYSKFSP